MHVKTYVKIVLLMSEKSTGIVLVFFLFPETIKDRTICRATSQLPSLRQPYICFELAVNSPKNIRV